MLLLNFDNGGDDNVWLVFDDCYEMIKNEYSLFPWNFHSDAEMAYGQLIRCILESMLVGWKLKMKIKHLLVLTRITMEKLAHLNFELIFKCDSNVFDHKLFSSMLYHFNRCIDRITSKLFTSNWFAIGKFLAFPSLLIN